MSSTVAQVKVVLLGDSGVGKSSLLYRYVTDVFDSERQSTMGASFMSKQVVVGQKLVRFNIWDTAGQERYQSLAKMYYRDAIAAVLVYDVSNPQTFRSLARWLDELKEHGPKDILVAIAGNKDDLNRTINPEEQEWAQSQGALYRRTSAKTNIGVDQLFLDIAQKLNSASGDLLKGAKRRVSGVPIKQVQVKNAENKHGCCAGKTA